MNDQARQEWSQHYDKLQWTVITITTAGLGALIAASFNTANKCQLWPEISGLLLSILGTAYVASFRVFRNRLHQAIVNKELRDFLDDPGDLKGNVKWFAKLPAEFFAQWNLFIGSFLAVDILFLYRLTRKGFYPCIVGWILFLSMMLILRFIEWKGASGGRDCRSKEQKNVTDSTQAKTLSNR
jgi:hypothetical protein